MAQAIIEDEEFQQLFAAESEEHLASIEQGLLELENNAEDDELLHSIFRSAHSLKGAARVLGLQDIETIAHLLEETLGQAHKKVISLDEAAIDRLYRGIDALKNLCKQALGEDVEPVDIISVADELKGKSDPAPTKSQPNPDIPKAESKPDSSREPDQQVAQQDSSTVTPAAPAPEVKQAPQPVPENPKSAEVPNRRVAENQMGTIRVPAEKLDFLLSMAGELIISKIRFEKRMDEISNLVDNWDGVKKGILSTLESKFRRDSDEFGAVSSSIESLGKEILNLRKGMMSYRSFHEGVVTDLDQGVRSLRLLPVGSLFQQLKRPVRDLSREMGKEIDLVLLGEDVTADKRIIENMKDPLIHMLRNSIDHGIESPEERKINGKPQKGKIRIEASRTSGNIIIKFSDDGKGLNPQKIRNKALQNGLMSIERLHSLSDEQIYELIFQPGFSTKQTVSNVSGRGVGMDVVRQNIMALKGQVRIETDEGAGTSFIMSFPVSLATAKVFLVRVSKLILAIPVDYIQRSLWVKRDSIKRVSGKNLLQLEGESIPVYRLRHLLKISSTDQEKRKKFPCLVVKDGAVSLALIVDELVDETDIVVKNQTDLLKKVHGIAGFTILESGQPATVIKVPDLFKDFILGDTSLDSSQPTDSKKATESQAKKESQEVLLVEDSLLTRLQQKRMLEAAGLSVTEAADGLIAWDLLHQRSFDLIVSDIEMPHMTGLELTEKIKSEDKFKDIPVILVTTLGSDDDKKRGLDAGADAYLPKGNLAYDTLIDSIRRLL